jgi:hypothetical protein
MNRLTGNVSTTQNEAVGSELDLLGGRFQRIADNFDNTIAYGCIDGPATFRGCNGHCSGRDATTCAGIPAIMVCPGFWTFSENGQATLLIHEAAHMIWAGVVHTANYGHASCYANFVADIFHAPTTTPDCPVPKH